MDKAKQQFKSEGKQPTKIADQTVGSTEEQHIDENVISPRRSSRAAVPNSRYKDMVDPSKRPTSIGTGVVNCFFLYRFLPQLFKVKTCLALYTEYDIQLLFWQKIYALNIPKICKHTLLNTFVYF